MEIEEAIDIIDKELHKKWDNKIEKIDSYIAGVGAVNDENIEEYIHTLFEQEALLIIKVNKIIDVLNKENSNENKIE